MKAIKERAELNLQYERNFLGLNLSDNMVCRAYCKGATEQKALDIEKALEWIKSNLDSDEGGEIELCFRKAMED